MIYRERELRDLLDDLREDSPVALATALTGVLIAEELKTIGTHLKYLGSGDAAGTMGAIELLAVKVDESGDAVAGAFTEAGGAITEATDALLEIAEALQASGEKLVAAEVAAE